MRPPRIPPDELRGILIMVATAVATALAAHGVDRSAAALGAIAVAEAGLLSERHLRRGHQLGLAVTLAAGFTALFLAPRGIAEIPILVAAARVPQVMQPRHLSVVVLGLALAFGASVVIISGSAVGLLSAVGVWLLAQRTVANDELEAERDRAVALLSEIQARRDDEAEAAALQERARIARDVHDVLAHSLAGLSLHLQAARALAVSDRVPDPILTQLDAAAALAREGMSEARVAVSALRTDTAGKGVDSLPALIGRFPGVARLRTSGVVAALSPAAGQAVYRAIQESLTNAARYAPGAPVSIALEWSAMELVATVSDEGSARRAGGAGGGAGAAGTTVDGVRAGLASGATGNGLRGLAERFDEVGGRFTAGPVGRGWVVRLAVPVGGAP